MLMTIGDEDEDDGDDNFLIYVKPMNEGWELLIYLIRKIILW